MGRTLSDHPHHDTKPVGSLAAFACPNPDCSHFNRFAAGNLSVVEWIGKHKDIRGKRWGTGGPLRAVVAWVHVALAVVSRFVIDLRLGPRDLATAAALVASVAVSLPAGAAPP
jgi:hypothetical protein